MQGLYELNETEWAAPDFTNVPLKEIVISNDGASDHENEADEHVDTSFILADETRGDGEPVEAETSGGDKKPPFGTPSGRTSFEDPEEEGRQERESLTLRLGAVASGIEAEVDNSTDLQAPEGMEVISRGDTTIVVNRDHSQPELVERAVELVANDGPWFRVPIDTARERTFLKDSEEDPKLFAKVTDAIDEPGGMKELTLVAEVKSVVDSDQAQEIAQKYGFSGIGYVAPLAVVDQPDRQQTTIYPWQEGTHPFDNDTLSESDRTAQLETLGDVAQNLRGLMGANGIKPVDLDSFQLLVDDNNQLKLLDIEDYETFEPAEPTLAQGEAIHVTEAGQYDITEAGRRAVSPGDFVVGRQGADGTGIEVATTTQNGYAVALWNTHTGESGFFSISNPYEAHEQITTVTDDIPSLTGPETVAHLIGPARVDELDGTRRSLAYQLERALGTDDISHISSNHSQLSIINSSGGSTVAFNTGSGVIEVFNEQGLLAYSFTPPKPVSGQGN